MAKKPTRARTKRREAARADDALTRAKQKLAALEPGGAKERPLEVQSASQVEGRAASIACLRCGEPSKVIEHRAITHPGVGALREVDLVCSRCGLKRTVWLRVGPVLH